MEYIATIVSVILVIRSILEIHYAKEQKIKEESQLNYNSKEKDEKERNRRKQF